MAECGRPPAGVGEGEGKQQRDAGGDHSHGETPAARLAAAAATRIGPSVPPIAQEACRNPRRRTPPSRRRLGVHDGVDHAVGEAERRHGEQHGQPIRGQRPQNESGQRHQARRHHGEAHAEQPLCPVSEQAAGEVQPCAGDRQQAEVVEGQVERLAQARPEHADGAVRNPENEDEGAELNDQRAAASARGIHEDGRKLSAGGRRHG